MMFLNIRQGLRNILILFGVGDHGGGITNEMVKDIEELKKRLRKNLSVEYCTSMEFLDTLSGVIEKKGLPVVDGELFLQFHRGTYSSQVRIKELIKRAEYYLEVLEKLLVVRYLIKRELYERSLIRNYWFELLTAQFHDVASGSLSKRPYNEFRNKLENLIVGIRGSIEKYLIELARYLGDKGNEDYLVFFNPLPRDITFRISCKDLMSYGLNVNENSCYKVLHIPSLGLKAVSLKELMNETPTNGDNVRVYELNGKIILENRYLKLVVDKTSGKVVSLFSKELNVEFLSGKGIRFELYDDRPVLGRVPVGRFDKPFDYFFDAWEVYYLQQPDGVRVKEMTKPSEIRVSRTTKSQASITIKYDYLESNECKVSIEHTLSLHANVPWIEGMASIEWNCKHKLLKLAFDLNFWAEHLAVGQPYGHVLRRNPGSPYSTLHDRAKWEANYQGWIDYSDGKKGLAFICGTRFGYDHISRTLRITILRSPRFPPEVFDRPWTRELIESQEYFESGSYNLRYFILPHRGDFKQAEVPTIAEELLTRPYIVKVKLRKPFTLSMMEANPKRLSIPAIKLHEDKDSLI
ncbi:MAG TPA: hypothetical protein ENG05_01640, partial [Acidilobales archaeon]|nr:hypothetical protein [Acidilobales archaeon]